MMLLDYYKGPTGSSRPKLGLHWLFVIGSLFGRGVNWLLKTKLRNTHVLNVLKNSWFQDFKQKQNSNSDGHLANGFIRSY